MLIADRQIVAERAATLIVTFYFDFRGLPREQQGHAILNLSISVRIITLCWMLRDAKKHNAVF